MKKTFTSLLTVLAAIATSAQAQTVINLGLEQNPLFEVSTNNVTAALPSDGTTLTLGADLTVKGGSGTYAYSWTDTKGSHLGNEASLTVSEPGIYLLTISDACQCSQEVTFNVLTAGIEQISPDDATITVNGSDIRLTGIEARQASLFTASGIMAALITPDTPACSFSFSHIPAGIYLLQITTVSDIVITRKIKLGE